MITDKQQALELKLRCSKAVIIIGIDPDVAESGVATFNRRRRQLTLGKYRFPELLQLLSTTQKMCEQNHLDLAVVIEAGYLNKKANLHYKGDRPEIAARVGLNVGANHETARKIVEMCRYWHIPAFEIAPLQKIWGKDRKQKISSEEFNALTGYTRQTNQDVRDAGLICWTAAGLQITRSLARKKKTS